MVVYYGRAGYFSMCALLSSPFDTVDHLMNGLVGGVGGLIMLIDWYLKIISVPLCVFGGGGLKAVQTVLQYHIHNVTYT